ncbi:MAG: tetratricopeptide repeat protein [Bacteroidia bacterium]|nr:tetratricopeptide repeat protein [Bacteroidia bacterium]
MQNGNNKQLIYSLFESLRNSLNKDLITMRNVRIYVLFGILVVTFIIYFGSLSNDFANYDDNYLIVNNKDIRVINAETLGRMFSYQYYGHYYPLTMLSFALEYHFAGLSPVTYHYTNLILHLLNIILVFYLFYLITDRNDISFIISALFAVHPMQVESVAWLGARCSVLYAFFFLSSLVSYIQYLRKDRKTILFIICTLLFIMALMSKSSAIVLPLILLLIDYYFSRKLSIRLVIEKVILLGFSVLWGILALLSAKIIGSIEMSSQYYSIVNKILIVIYSYIFYIAKFFVPVHLSCIHYNPVLTDGWLPLEYYLAPAGIFIILALLIFFKKFRKDMIFSILLYSITIGLVIRIIPIGGTVVCERYFYLPSLGIAFIIAALFKRIIDSKVEKIKRIWPVLFLLFVPVLIVFSIATHNRSKVWANGLTLFSDVIEKYPERGYGYYCRGNVRVALDKLSDALPDFNKALMIEEAWDYYLSRGNTLSLLGRHDDALHDYNRALEIYPTNFEINKSRGTAYANLKMYDKALEDFSLVIEKQHNNFEAYYNRGIIYSRMKNYFSAIKDYSKAIELKNDFKDAYFNRGNSKKKMGDMQGACADWIKAMELGEEKAKINLARNCIEKKDTSQTTNSSLSSFQEINNKTEQPADKRIVAVNKQDNTVIISDKKSGQKNKVKVIVTTENGKDVKKIIRYNDKGMLVEQGVINDKGDYDGKVEWYFDSGNPKISGNYKGIIPYGKWMEFYENGITKAEYTYKEGKKDGVYKYYHPNGNLWTERVYKEGKLWEVISNYLLNGGVKNPGTLKAGTGEINIYDEKGNLISKEVYENGDRVR